MKSFLVTLCLGLVLAVGVQVQSAEACCPTQKMGKDVQSCPVMSLGLTKEQQNKIKRIEHKYSSNIENQHKKLDKIRAELNKKLQKGEPDDVIRTEYIKLTDVKALKAQMQIDKVLEIRSVLTSDQTAKYEGFRNWNHKCDHGKSCKTKSSKKMCH